MAVRGLIMIVAVRGLIMIVIHDDVKLIF
jgi:hypothetical protein